MLLDELRNDLSIRQRKGLHFILSSVIIWSLIVCVHLTNLPQLTKNLLTFFCTSLLLPLSIFISRYIGVDFQSKDNPLAKLGLLFSLNQILYLLIAMWVFPTVPDKFLMVMGIIFGAHFLPFTWLYQSVGYLSVSIAIPLVTIGVGLFFSPLVVAVVVLGIQVVFTIRLIFEVRKLIKE